MRLHRTLLAAAAVAGLGGGASAATLIDTVGDEDCFGFDPGDLPSCPDGGLIPTVAPIDRSDPADPAGTDKFGVLGTLSFDFFVDLGGEPAISASVSTLTAGIDLGDEFGFGDAFTGARFLFNGTDLGTFYNDAFDVNRIPQSDPNAPLRISLLDFSVLGLLNDNATNTLTIIPEEGFEQFNTFEDYAVDYARLTIETQAAAVVPLPASLVLLMSGAGGLILFGRRRRA